MVSESFKDLKILRCTGVQSVPPVFPHVVQRTELCSPKESIKEQAEMVSALMFLSYFFS